MATYWKVGEEAREIVPLHGALHRDKSWTRSPGVFTTDELQGYVGGPVELVYLNDGRVMVINAVGSALGLPWNKLASELAHEQIGFYRDVVGSVLLCTPDELHADVHHDGHDN